MMHILEWQKPEAYFPQAGKYMALLHLGSIYKYFSVNKSKNIFYSFLYS